MRFIFTLFLSLLLFVSQSFAGLPPTRSGGQSGSMTTTFDFKTPFNQATKVSGTAALIETGNVNLLKNPGFEAATYSTSWTASGGSSSVGTTTDIGTGAKSYKWDSSSAAQTLVSDAITIPEALKGLAGEASCYIKVPSGTATHKIQVWDGSSAVAEKLISTETTFVQNKISFTIPTSGTIAVRLLSVASNEPSISIDDCYIGRERGPPDTVNYLNYNPDAEQGTGGWATYADAAQATPENGTAGTANSTWTRTTSTPLRGSGSFLWSKTGSASRIGEGVSYDFTIDKADKGKSLRGSFDYQIASGTYADDDLQVFVYDVTNSALIYTSPSKIKNHTLDSEPFPFEFQTASSSTSYRLIIHTASSSTANYTVKFDNFKVGPTPKQYGAVVTDWQTYTLSLTASGGGLTKATTRSELAQWRRVGDSIEIKYDYHHDSASGAAGGTGNYIWGLPSGITVDTAKIQAAQTNGYETNRCGSATITYGSGGGTVLDGYMRYEPGAGLYMYSSETATGYTIVSASNRQIAGNATIGYSFYCKLPVLGWSSSQLLSSDADTRVVAALYTGAPPTGTLNASLNTIVYGTKVTDTHGAYSAGTYTVPVSGYYDISAQAGMAATYSASNNALVSIHIDGTRKYDGNIGLGGAAGNAYPAVSVKAIPLTAGQLVTIKSANSGTTPTYSSNAYENYFSITKVQGPAQIAASEVIAFAGGGTVSGTLNSSANVAKFQTIDRDSHGGYSTSTGLYTIQAPGWYHVSAQVAISATYSSADALELYVYKNAAEIKRTLSRAVASMGQASIGIQTLVYCVPGDTLGIYADTPATSPTYSGTTYLNHISIHRLGGI